MKKNKPHPKAAPRAAAVSAAPKKQPSGDSLLDRLEAWLTLHSKTIFWTIFSLSVLFGLLLFDVKISEGNDDALYIEGGYNYAQNFTGYYFTANAPLYPMLLGLVIKLVGMKLMVLKLISFMFFLAAILMFKKAFFEIIPMNVFYPALIFLSLNSFFIYYASQTYTETLFLFLQFSFLFITFKILYLIDVNQKVKSKHWIIYGLIIFLLITCKSVGLGALIAILIFSILDKQWKFILFTFLSFAFWKIPFEIAKITIWGNLSKSSQLATLLQVDPYNASKGTENMDGLITRFFSNFDLYISKRIPQILGFKSIEDNNVHSIVGVFLSVLLILGAYYIYKKKNKYLLLTFIYSSVLCCITFVVLQTRWDQPRLILVLMPTLIIIMLFGLFSMIKMNSILNLFYIVMVAVMMISFLIVTSRKTFENIPVLTKNLKGDIFYGYSNDWSNYLKISRWCSENLPHNSYVACRKAPMSFVYGNGMKFFPVYNVYALDEKSGMANPDSVLNYFKREGVTHVILANLRRNPKKVDGYVINTMHRMLTPISNKYPNKLKLIKSIGQSEAAYLYKINY